MCLPNLVLTEKVPPKNLGNKGCSWTQTLGAKCGTNTGVSIIAIFVGV